MVKKVWRTDWQTDWTSHIAAWSQLKTHSFVPNANRRNSIANTLELCLFCIKHIFFVSTKIFSTQRVNTSLYIPYLCCQFGGIFQVKFIQRLNMVGRESNWHQQQVLLASLRHPLDGVIRLRSQPRQRPHLGLPDEAVRMRVVQFLHHMHHRGTDLGWVRVTTIHYLKWLGENQIFMVSIPQEKERYSLYWVRLICLPLVAFHKPMGLWKASNI